MRRLWVLTMPLGSVLQIAAGLLSGWLALAFQSAPAGQGPRSAAKQRLESSAAAVVVDVVVRDSAGQPVTDLAEADFTLLEEGIEQEISTMTVVAPSQRGGDLTDVPAGNDGQVSRYLAREAQTVTAILFDRLTPESRRDAWIAARSYLEVPERSNDFVGVFLGGLSLQTIQTFTNNRKALEIALQTAAKWATTFQTASRIGTGTGETPATIGAEYGGASNSGSRDMRVDTLAGLGAALDGAFRGLENLQHGHAGITSLRWLVEALAVLPGRKSLIYFSDSLPLTGAHGGEGLRARFHELIRLANRANVTIYSIDAVGLRVHSQQLANGLALSRAGARALESEGGGGVGNANEMLLAGTTSQVFNRLSRETGGFAIENTNDLAGGFRRIDADRRFHYLLTYTPRNQDFNGEFRRIEVKVGRPDVSVRARSGYLAVRSPGVIPTLRHEAGALAALEAGTRADAVPITSRVLRIPEADEPGQLAVLVRVPADGVTFQQDRATSEYRTDFTILARIRDEHGHVVRKGSQAYRLTGSLENRADAERGDVLFFRQPVLPPGRYTVEVAVFDTLAEKAGIGTLQLEIPDGAPGAIDAGDLVIVRRAEAVPPGERDEANPLLLNGEVLLYPNVGEPLPAAVPQTLTLFVVARPAEGRPGLQAALTVARDRKALVTAPVEVASPGSDGFVRQVVQLPLPALAPGEYAVTLKLGDGQNTTYRTARFVVGAASEEGPETVPVP
jgi:VWFA-related protein